MASNPEGSEPTEEATESGSNVTFRGLFGLPEFRAVYLSSVTSWIGDYLSRAAVTVLVYQQTRSVLLSAISFALGYLPWILAGPLLASLGDRYPHRRVMVIADVYRMTLTALLLIPGLPPALILLVVLLNSLGSPPAQAARSAMLPLVVGRERLTLAIAIQSTSTQAAMVTGYLIGATVAVGVNPRLAIGLDVCTYAISALLIATQVRARPAAVALAQRQHLLQETAEGFRVVFGNPVLRSIAIVVFAVVAFFIVPESLAASWAAQAVPNGSRGLNQGMIMAAGPFGFVVGGLLFSRLVPADRRRRMTPLLAVVTPLVLTPVLLSPPPFAVALLVTVSGLAQGALQPTLNAAFVLVLPPTHRARAFGVMNSGMQASQFAAVLITGSLADTFRIPLVVGLWSVAGTLAMGAVAVFWPNRARFSAAEQDASAETPPPATAPPFAAPPVTAPPKQAEPPVTPAEHAEPAA
ncbi:MFS transporter [Actinoplanes palleronii]|uniref:MFS transporter n=1 Tax=Actinoplanes palleronii TaxID=113570 RepID=A0ABQ4BS17_9ACTN|nr:MFS transporter [Actinoplanes palleronii]GIE73479.1 MFS transporter [Actinoplanes palleronii]